MVEWISAGLALFGAVIGPYVGYRVSEAVNKRRWDEMDEIVKRFQQYHKEHFDSISVGAQVRARLEQQITSHERSDDERFERIEAMFREIRDALRSK